MQKKNLIWSLVAAAFLALTAFIFFFPDDLEGNVLQQHDILQGLANGQEGKAFHEATGETTRWTNSLFGGMPNFQIAPSYPANNMLNWISKIYMLGLPSPANLLFGMMIGFFIMCLCLKIKWPSALFAAIAWGFSSYFIIIIGAGHIWKFLTLCYIPPTIGGLALLYRGKYVWGTTLTALFGALQLQSNHPQMSYYFMIVILCMIAAWLYTAIREKKIRKWVIATVLACMAGGIAIGANAPSLYNSLLYSKETVRGKATDLQSAETADSAAGMDRDAITAWSYSPGETFTLLIPNVKGGATIKPVRGQNHILPTSDTKGSSEVSLSPEEMQFVSQFPQYFGDQPMTNGPVYVGAFVLLLAILGLFTINGKMETPLKWGLLAASVIAILLSWGHNFPALTYFMIDNFPGYNKFRAVASILVVVEFTIPLLAALTLRQMVKDPDYFKKNRYTIYAVFGLGAAVCFFGWVTPSIFGNPYSAQETQLLTGNGLLGNPAYSNALAAISKGRLSLVSADSLRSLIYIIGCAIILWLWSKKNVTSPYMWILLLSALALLDLYGVGKRYVNTENFVEAANDEQAFEPTEADRLILQDTTNYRVLDIDGFSDARSSYFHKTIGGYHAAKLTRYNDLIQNQILKNNPEVINMLNAKYFISGGEVIANDEANGNAWFVDSVIYVQGANREMSALDTLPTKHLAVADIKYRPILGEGTTPVPGDTIYQTSYAPNRLGYSYRKAKPGIAVFSEVFFPWGWEALIDGKPAEIGRVDYTLRAVKVPAGNHTIEMKFDPQSVRTTSTLSMVCVIAIYLLGGLSLIVLCVYFNKKANTRVTKS